jgi:hypothetical protein
MLILLSGCSGQPVDESAKQMPVEEPPIIEVIPLTVGNSWHYQINGASSVVESSYIEKKERWGDVQWYLMNNLGVRSWVRNSRQGQVEAVKFLGNSGDKKGRLVENLVMKFPYRESENYTTDYAEVSVQNCLRPVKVPAGEFKCVKYTYSANDGDYYIHYVVPEVGIVKSESYKDGKVKVAELKVYRLH